MPATRKQSRQRRGGPTRRRAARGGKIVYSGAYGCAFRPAVKCQGENTRRPGMISKLMGMEEAEEEYAIKERFAAIDPKHEYFIYPEHMCKPNSTPSEEDNFGDCSVVNMRNMYTRPRLILSRDGGEDLLHVQVNNEDYVAFFAAFANLFDGLDLLHRHDMIHMDIKPANIVAQRTANGNYSLRFIDMGMTQMLDSFAVQTANYAYWPFDLRLLDSRVVPNRRMFGEYYAALAWNRAAFPYWAYVQADGSPLDEEWAEKIRRRIQTRRIDTERIAKGVDVFGLGRSLIEVYTRLTGHLFVRNPGFMGFSPRRGKVVARSVNIGNAADLTAFHKRLADMVSLPLFKLVAEMIEPDPSIRITALEAGAKYRALLPAIHKEFEDFPAIKRVLPLKDPGDAPST